MFPATPATTAHCNKNAQKTQLLKSSENIAVPYCNETLNV